MKTFTFVLCLLAINYLPSVECEPIEFGPTIEGINALLGLEDVVKKLGKRYSIRHILQLENQASSCANWLLKNPDKIGLSPQIKNKDLNVVFLPERFYKRHTHRDNVPYNVEVPPNSDPSTISIHSRDYGDSNQVVVAALSNLLNDDTWLMKGIKYAGLEGIGGVIKEHEDYYLVVFAMQVIIYQKYYPGKTPRHKIVPLDLNVGPTPSHDVPEENFATVEDDEIIPVIVLNPGRTLSPNQK